MSAPTARSVEVTHLLRATRDLLEHVAGAAASPTPVSQPMFALVTHYGESYNGQVLGCGSGLYSSDNPTIVAVSPHREGQMPCGTLLQICGEGGCTVGVRQDACPGCSANLFDLSESGFERVCGVPSGVCNATVSVIEACRSMDLGWEEAALEERRQPEGTTKAEKANSPARDPHEPGPSKEPGPRPVCAGN